jgi:DNA-binding transcriptional MocR family regulator
MTGQKELFSAETTWFHVFRSLIDSGDLARMGPHAFAVYAVVKSHVHFTTGSAFPSVELISEKSGVSVRQVKRELATLQELGYLTITKNGRTNVYGLREKVGVTDQHGRPAAVATWDYLPASVAAAVADLKNVMVSGDLAGARVVHIERLIVNVAAQGGTVVNIDASRAPEELRQKLAEFAASIAGRGADGGAIKGRRKPE